MQVRDFQGTMTIEIISLVKAQGHPERSNNAPVLHSSTSEDVLGGGSWSGGWNITPWWGVQGSKNSNGYTAGLLVWCSRCFWCLDLLGVQTRRRLEERDDEARVYRLADAIHFAHRGDHACFRNRLECFAHAFSKRLPRSNLPG